MHAMILSLPQLWSVRENLPSPHQRKHESSNPQNSKKYRNKFKRSEIFPERINLHLAIISMTANTIGHRQLLSDICLNVWICTSSTINNILLSISFWYIHKVRLHPTALANAIVSLTNAQSAAGCEAFANCVESHNNYIEMIIIFSFLFA